MGMAKPIFQLTPGTKIKVCNPVNSDKVRHWKFAKECPDRFPPLSPGAVLEISEVNAREVPPWVRAWVPNTHQTMSLKIAGQELAHHFELA
jgi:hypothetical protein